MSDEEEEMTVGDADSANNNSGGCFSCCGGKDKKPKKKSDMLPKPDTSIQKKEAEVEHTTVKNSLDSNSPPYSKQASTPPHTRPEVHRETFMWKLEQMALSSRNRMVGSLRGVRHPREPKITWRIQHRARYRRKTIAQAPGSMGTSPLKIIHVSRLDRLESLVMRSRVFFSSYLYIYVCTISFV